MKKQKAFIATINFFLLTLVSQVGMAQESALVFTLPFGSYAVGFTSVNQYDYSRSFEKYDMAGKLINEGGARPIQTSIWYPAVDDGTTSPMLYEEYAYLVANEAGVPEMTDEMKTNAKKMLKGFYSSPEARFENEMASRTNALKDAKPAPGPFPVVVYAPSFNAQSSENSVLCEYIASHGYIVVASPCMGMRSRPMTDDLVGLETQALDIGFLISFTHGYPHADAARLAVMGFSWGGISNVMAKMRNDNIKALVCLDGAIRYDPKLFKESPFADMSKINVPLMYLAQKNWSFEELASLDLGTSGITDNFYNSLKYSDAYLVTFNHLWHQNFASSFIKLKERNPDRFNERSQEEVNQSYEWVCLCVLNFLDAYLKNDAQGLAFLQNKPEQNGIPPYLVTLQSKAGEKSPPSMMEFAHMLREQGFDKADQTYEEIRRRIPDFALKENEVNSWGYWLLLGYGKMKEAIEIFKLNAELYPESTNVYDSLGEAYMMNGDKELAIENYQKSLELNPKNANAIARLKKLKEEK
jgi:dienelactone hydrolase